MESSRLEPVFRNFFQATQTNANETLRAASTSVWGEPPVITQAELGALQELKQQKKALNERLKEVRDEIRNKLMYNTRIEPGSLSAELRTSEARNFSFDKLVALIGEQEAAELRDQIEPTISTRLMIRESSSAQ